MREFIGTQPSWNVAKCHKPFSSHHHFDGFFRTSSCQVGTPEHGAAVGGRCLLQNSELDGTLGCDTRCFVFFNMLAGIWSTFGICLRIFSGILDCSHHIFVVFFGRQLWPAASMRFSVGMSCYSKVDDANSLVFGVWGDILLKLRRFYQHDVVGLW